MDLPIQNRGLVLDSTGLVQAPKSRAQVGLVLDLVPADPEPPEFQDRPAGLGRASGSRVPRAPFGEWHGDGSLGTKAIGVTNHAGGEIPTSERGNTSRSTFPACLRAGNGSALDWWFCAGAHRCFALTAAAALVLLDFAVFSWRAVSCTLEVPPY